MENDTIVEQLDRKPAQDIRRVETVSRCVILLITQFTEMIPRLQGHSHMEFTKMAVTPSKGFRSA